MRGSDYGSWVRFARLPLLLAGGGCFVIGVWLGLARAGIPLGVPEPRLLALHGPLMVLGFLATLISLERAVGSGVGWCYAAPATSVVASCLLMLGAPVEWVASLYLLAALLLTSVLVRLWFRHRAWYTVLFAFSGACLVVGNVVWLATLSVTQASGWWLAFLLATIAGERMELSRVTLPPAWAQPALFSMFMVLIVGVLCGGLETRAGTTLTGLVLIGMAAWLARFDVARRTVRHPGMPRYVAVGLLSGFVWLAVAGVLALTQPLLFGGFVYDGILHSVFLGFVFSMIFAHAPMIFPAILHVRVPYHWVFYLHWLTLHVSLTLRVLGDISGSWFLRTWGILGNGAALALFLATTLTQVLRGAQQQNHAAVRARG